MRTVSVNDLVIYLPAAGLQPDIYQYPLRKARRVIVTSTLLSIFRSRQMCLRLLYSFYSNGVEDAKGDMARFRIKDMKQ